MEHKELEIELALEELPVASSEQTGNGQSRCASTAGEPASEKIASRKNKPGEITIGVLEGMDEQGHILVDFAENPDDRPLVAISTVAVSQNQAGQQVALLFADGKIENPVIMGIIHNPLGQMIDSFEMMPERSSAQPSIQMSDEKAGAQAQAPVMEDAYVDGKRVVLEGRDEIVLKCGEASITLTKTGKILIRGKYLLNRSTGVNRIMGGSVQVN